MRVMLFAIIVLGAVQEPGPFEKIRELAAVNNYEGAIQMCADAEKTFIKLKDAETVLKLRETRKELEALKKEYAKVKEADAKLTTEVDDPEANLVMGRFWAFVREDWAKAIPLLAKSSDPFLKTLAEAETKAAPTLNGPQKLAIGDAWWTGSQEVDAKMLTGATSTFKISVDRETLKKAKGQLKARAIWWYSEAWPLLDDGERQKIRPKFKAHYTNAAAGPDKKGTFEGWQHWDIRSAADRSGSYVRSGKFSLRGVADSKGEMHVKMLTKVRLIPGRKYELSAWCLTEGDIRGVIEVQARNDLENNIFGPTAAVNPDRPFWFRTSVAFTAPKGVSDGDFRITVGGNNCQLWLDDLSLISEGKELIGNGSFEK